jgi:transposase
MKFFVGNCTYSGKPPISGATNQAEAALLGSKYRDVWVRWIPPEWLLQQINGLGTETADMLTHEVLSRDLRDQRAVARYAGLTGSPDESGRRRREKGLAKAGNARVRRGMIQFAWRFLIHQKDSALAQWYQASVAGGGKKRKTMVVALARKLLIALWRFVKTGEVPQGVVLRPAT